MKSITEFKNLWLQNGLYKSTDWLYSGSGLNWDEPFIFQKIKSQKALAKQIQHFTEQHTTFVLGEKLDLFDQLLYCAQCCSMLLCGV